VPRGGLPRLWRINELECQTGAGGSFDPQRLSSALANHDRRRQPPLMSDQVSPHGHSGSLAPTPLPFPTNPNRCIGRSTISRNATGTCTYENSSIVSLQRATPTMTFGGTGSGNPAGRPRGSRNRAILNEEFIAALLRHFRKDGERAIARMAATQPAAYCKLLTLLVPREHQIQHSNPVKHLTDQQLEAAIEYIEAALAAKAGDQAKVIEGIAEPAALPAPELEPQRKRPNRLLEHAYSAVGPKERKPRKRNAKLVPPPS
jgi:hypothetical protein